MPDRLYTEDNEIPASARWWGTEDLSVGGDPVGGDHVLGGGEGDAVRAEQVVQCVLEFVLGVRGGSRLGPEVRRTVGSAPQLEGHQVVEFVRRGPVALPVGGLSQTFLTVGDARGWPHGGGVAAAAADRALECGVGDVGVDGPGVQAGSGSTPLAACRAWQLPAAGKGWTALCAGSVTSRPPGSETEVDAGAVDVADAPMDVVVAVVVGAAVVSTGELVAPQPTASQVRAASATARRVRTQVRAQRWFIGSPRTASDSCTDRRCRREPNHGPGGVVFRFRECGGGVVRPG